MKKLWIMALLCPAIALAQTYPSPTFDSLTLQNPLTVANGGTGSTSATGSGSLVLSNTPVLSGPSISGGSINGTPIGAATPNTGAFTTLNASGDITQPSTGLFFTQQGANINRLGDRIFLGGFTKADGSYPPVTSDWFSAYENTLGYTNSTPSGSLAVSPPNTVHGGTVAATFAAQSLNAAAAGASTIPVEAFAINNNASMATDAWAFYGEAHLASASAGSVYGMELDTHSLYPTSSPTPYGQGNVVGLQLAAGAGIQGARCTGSVSGSVLTMVGCSNIVNYNIQVGSIIYGAGVAAGTEVVSLGTGTGADGTYNLNNSQSISSEAMVATPQYPASAAIQIESNPLAFNAGIVFGADALAGDDGLSGQATAIGLGKGQNINWYVAGGARAANIVSTVSAASNGTGINFTDAGLEVFSENSGAPAIALFTPASSAVNYLSFTSAATGGVPVIQAQGADPSINLYVEGKGSGQVSTNTSGFTAPGNEALFYQDIGTPSVPSGVATTVTGWTKVADRLNSDFDGSTGIYTAPVSGYYHISAGISFAASASSAVGAPYQIVVEVGTTYECSNVSYANTTAPIAHNVDVSCVVAMGAGQTAQIVAIQNSGSPVSLSGSGPQNFLSIARVP